MDTSIVHEFVVLAQIGNFQTAADELLISQSALSKHIKKLEDELGVPLFDRSKRTIILNKYGHAFLENAERICALVDEAVGSLHELHADDGTHLCFGFMEQQGQYGVVETIAAFNKLHPEIRVSMMESRGDRLRSLLDSGICDFVFSAKYNEEDAGLRSTRYCTDEMSVVLPAAHPLAQRESLTLADLHGERFIEHNTALEVQLVNESVKSMNCIPNYVTSISNTTTILRMVRQGLGFTIISKASALAHKLPDLAVVAFLPKTTFNIYLLSVRRRKLSAAAKAFLRYIEETADSRA